MSNSFSQFKKGLNPSIQSFHSQDEPGYKVFSFDEDNFPQDTPAATTTTSTHVEGPFIHPAPSDQEPKAPAPKKSTKNVPPAPKKDPAISAPQATSASQAPQATKNVPQADDGFVQVSSSNKRQVIPRIDDYTFIHNIKSIVSNNSYVPRNNSSVSRNIVDETLSYAIDGVSAANMYNSLSETKSYINDMHLKSRDLFDKNTTLEVSLLIYNELVDLYSSNAIDKDVFFNAFKDIDNIVIAFFNANKDFMFGPSVTKEQVAKFINSRFRLYRDTIAGLFTDNISPTRAINSLLSNLSNPPSHTFLYDDVSQIGLISNNKRISVTTDHLATIIERCSKEDDNQNLVEKYNSLVDSYKQLHANCTSLQQDLDSVNDKHATLQQELDSANNEKATLQQKLDNSQQNLNTANNKLADVTRERDNATSQCISLRKERDNATSQCISLQEKCNKLSLENASLQQNLDTLQQDYSSLQENLEEVTYQRDSFSTGHDAVSSNERVLEKEYTLLYEKYDTLHKDHIDLMDKYKRLEISYESLLGENNSNNLKNSISQQDDNDLSKSAFDLEEFVKTSAIAQE